MICGGLGCVSSDESPASRGRQAGRAGGLGRLSLADSRAWLAALRSNPQAKGGCGPRASESGPLSGPEMGKLKWVS